MIDNLICEINFKFSRSSGPGGQSVNKVETRVILLFDVEKSFILTNEQKIIITKKLSNRINAEGILSLVCNETRSQLRNREIVINRFMILLEEALVPIKKRKPTRRSKVSVEKRLRGKKLLSDKKKDRKKKE